MQFVSGFQFLWKRESILWISLIGGTLLVYSNSLGNSFQYDDIHSIVENEHIRWLGNAPRGFLDPTLFSEDPKGPMYRPLVLASYVFNYKLGEYEVRGYRVFNLAIHVLNTLLVALLVRAVSGSRCQASVAAFYFGLLPVNGEVVNYISSRSESLCALFFLVGVVSYIRMAQFDTGLNRWTLPAVAGFLGALLSKSVGITYLGVILWYEMCRSRFDVANAARATYRTQRVFWLIGMVYLIGMNQLIAEALFEYPVRGTTVQVLTQAKALVYYVKLLFLPQSLNVEHQFFLAKSFFMPEVALSLSFLVSLAVIGWYVRWRIGLLVFWVGWPVIVLLPTILVPLNVLVNEHRLYLPSVAVAALVAGLVERVISRKAAVGVIFSSIAALVFADLSYARNFVWRDSESLWKDASRKAPFMPRPHIFTGDHLKRAGEYDAALQEYETALSVHPEVLSQNDRVVIYNNIGATYLAMGQFVDAVDAYQRALAIDPDYSKSKDSLEGLLAITAEDENEMAEKERQKGLAYLIAGQIPEAIENLRKSLRFQNRPDVWLALGVAYERADRLGDASNAYKALKIVGKGTGFAKTAEDRLAEIQNRLSSKE